MVTPESAFSMFYLEKVSPLCANSGMLAVKVIRIMFSAAKVLLTSADRGVHGKLLPQTGSKS